MTQTLRFVYLVLSESIDCETKELITSFILKRFSYLNRLLTKENVVIIDALNYIKGSFNCAFYFSFKSL